MDQKAQDRLRRIVVTVDPQDARRIGAVLESSKDGRRPRVIVEMEPGETEGELRLLSGLRFPCSVYDMEPEEPPTSVLWPKGSLMDCGVRVGQEEYGLFDSRGA